MPDPRLMGPTPPPTPTPSPTPMGPQDNGEGSGFIQWLLKKLFGSEDNGMIAPRPVGGIRPGVGSDTEDAYRELMDPNFRMPAPTPTPVPRY